MKIECIDKKSEDFPDKLKKLEKCPEQIYIQGNKRILSEFSLAIVGSRKCSILGKTIARDITEELARNNIVISSGLARGIDTVAHTACVENGSKTIAVLGGGHNKIYPVENKNLIKNIIEKEGAVISEYPPEYPTLRNNFRERNRIIAALSDGIILIEAKKNSGSLITINHARKLNKKIFVVPGRVNDEEYEGSNLILKDGAFCISNARDVLEKYKDIEFNLSSKNIMKVDVPEELKELYEILSFFPQSLDEISSKMDESINQILSKLVLLEIYNLIKRVNGNFFVKIKIV